ncbi:ADP-forming succinate--CoA ligase subunit beta [Alloscardovia theropitheci]|uniref:Succinate--CoA ligase [ADP-forming] subunit beta n=1 Tax=Alloscardovia theropitheci TaxID=2496842 RepID=A0A4R0QYP0_9BIFI|nr:ADP-forming succinate--CoA ligase subunit beta [Alloscardovia theropitheci]TCD54781.1 ADP-forming succinate--CoA ligase subunit beta [Alloscardovia theropitheci]
MDLYEYQARELLQEKDVPIPEGIFASTVEEAVQAANTIGYPCVLKAQVRIGHRGQAGGVKIVHDEDEARFMSEHILGMTIHGHKVRGLLVVEAASILHEYYVSISVDRSSRDYDVLATAAGGTEVEEIAKEHPEFVKRLHINPLDDFDINAAEKMAQEIGFHHADTSQAAHILLEMWKVFIENDATLVEINPLAKVGIPDDEASKHLMALDAKISLDSNAAFRHDGWSRFATSYGHDELEAQAAQLGLHYVHLDGNVGVIGNGAGLVMSSIDAVADAGQDFDPKIKPANFLDIGGGASAQLMAQSLDIVMSDPQVKSVFINVYGGITSCKQVAQGIIEAVDKLIQNGTTLCDIVVRFDGNEATEGLTILDNAHHDNIHVAQTMDSAAEEAVNIAARILNCESK